MELYNFFRIIGRRKWLIIAIIVIAFVASFASASTAKVPKEAHSVLHFNFSLPEEVDVQKQDFRFQVPPEQNAFDFVALFSTDEVLKAGIKKADADITLYQASKAINASVQVVKIGGEDERTSFIEVKCRHSDGDLAVKLVNSVTEAATELFQQIVTKSVTENRKFLEGQVVVYEAEIEDNEVGLREFLYAHPGFGQTVDDQSIATRKVQLDSNQSNLAAEVQGLDTKIRITTKDLAQYREGKLNNIPPAVKMNPNLQNLQDKVMSLQFDKAQASGRYSEKHPIVQKLDSEINETQQQIREEVIKLMEEEIEVYKGQRDEKTSQLGSFDSSLSNLLASTDEYAQARIEYNNLLQDWQIAHDIYGRVKTSLAESIHEENKAKQSYNVDVIERATEAVAPQELWFKPWFRIVLSVLGGTFIALVIAFIAEYASAKPGAAVAGTPSKA